MLGVVARETGLPEPVMRVAIPNWVIAETMNLLGGMSLLLVYRSTWLRDEDLYYSEVAELLGRSTVVEEVYRRTREDPDMMHGKAEWIVYLLDPVAAPDPRAQMIIDLGREWGDPLHPMDVPEAISERLQELREGVR